MAKIYQNLTDLIGRTPLLQLNNYGAVKGASAKIIAKLEYFNPLGSVKDRIAYARITDAEEKGLVKEGTVIIEPTSGNTGIGLAFVAAAKGYKLILTMPETMSIERRAIVSALGAEVVLTPGPAGMKGAIEKANEIHKATPNSFIPSQFENPNNPKAHKETTGVEIWNDTDGRVDIFVAGIGTGGTISGAGAYLREMNPSIKIIAVEPSDSPILSEGKAGSHKIQGIGAGFIPDTLDTMIYDEIITVKNDDAFIAAREIAKTDGVLVGISSGAAIWAATQLAKRSENNGKNIVVILPDTGERYLTTALFSE